MTNNRYVVLNCPAITEYKFPDKVHKDCCQCTYGYCKDINCVIKRVIEMCKAKKLDIYNPSIGNEHYAMANSVLSTQILQLFDIEEINNK